MRYPLHLNLETPVSATFPRERIALLFTLPFVLMACGGGGAQELDDVAEAPDASSTLPATVTILEPHDGAEVMGPDVRVVFRAEGIEIAPVDQGIEGTGHHHLFVNQEVTAAGQVIPANNPRIIHLGNGSSEYLLQGLEPGEYRLIAVVADLLHIPLVPPVTDTVHITVVGESP